MKKLAINIDIFSELEKEIEKLEKTLKALKLKESEQLKKKQLEEKIVQLKKEIAEIEGRLK